MDASRRRARLNRFRFFQFQGGTERSACASNRNTEDIKRHIQEEGAKTQAHTQKEGEKTRACIREEAARTRAEVTDLKRTYAALRAAMEGRRPADVVEP